MRVAANIVERVLIAAQDEARAERREGDYSSDYANIVEAFRRADELRREDFIYRRVRGRKSGAWQNVITTTQRRDGRTLCLLRYDGRRPFRFTVERKDEGGKVTEIEVVFHNCIPMFREQWINDDRLMEVA